MTSLPALRDLIQQGDWEELHQQVAHLLDQHTSDESDSSLRQVDDLTGSTLLHLLCREPSSPVSIVRNILTAFPEAVQIQEKTYRALPLHILCWSSPRSVEKVQLLLDRMTTNMLLLKNRFGGTVLHSACGSHAALEVIQAIVQAHPAILREKTYDRNHTALTALWHSHLQSIPGHLQIATILNGTVDEEELQQEGGHFQRFWSKLTFLAQTSFHLESPSSSSSADSDDEKQFVLHGLMHLRAPLNAIKVALRRCPRSASVADDAGNLPLHCVIMNRPFRLKDVELIRDLLTYFPQGAAKKNDMGDYPLFIALRNRMKWEEGLGDLLVANNEILTSFDSQTGLYPFLMAASLDGRVAVNNTYLLLRAKPDLMQAATFSCTC